MLGTVDRTRVGALLDGAGRRRRRAPAGRSGGAGRVLARLEQRAGCLQRCAASRAGAAAGARSADRGRRRRSGRTRRPAASRTRAAVVPDGAQRSTRPGARAQPARRIRDERAAHAGVPSRRGRGRACAFDRRWHGPSRIRTAQHGDRAATAPAAAPAPRPAPSNPLADAAPPSRMAPPNPFADAAPPWRTTPEREARNPSRRRSPRSLRPSHRAAS